MEKLKGTNKRDFQRKRKINLQRYTPGTLRLFSETPKYDRDKSAIPISKKRVGVLGDRKKENIKETPRNHRSPGPSKSGGETPETLSRVKEP